MSFSSPIQYNHYMSNFPLPLSPSTFTQNMAVGMSHSDTGGERSEDEAEAEGGPLVSGPLASGMG
jgi:hypothetical protein